MRITKFTARNYKSLRAVTIRPRDFNVLVGSNDAGKSNLADSLDFLGDVYRDGLRAAVARKGGFDGIVHRRQSSRDAAIGLSVTVEMDAPPEVMQPEGIGVARLRFQHEFHFGARATGIQEEYVVEREKIGVFLVSPDRKFSLLSIKRSTDAIELTHAPEWDLLAFKDKGKEASFPWNAVFSRVADLLGPSELLVSLFVRFAGPLGRLTDHVKGMRVFQFSPLVTRWPGLPSSDAELDRYGVNLPAVIDFLQREHPDTWGQVMIFMRRINPRLRVIEVEPTASKTLALFFREKGQRRPWSAAEVSDGTIQLLALLTAVFDPASTFLVLEEPENSVHPWIVRNIVEACHAVSEHKQVMLTTHSPILLDMVRPADVWLIWRNGRGSHVERLEEMEPGIEDFWRSGKVSISEFLDSGALASYVPAGVRPPDPVGEGEGREAD